MIIVIVIAFLLICAIVFIWNVVDGFLGNSRELE